MEEKKYTKPTWIQGSVISDKKIIEWFKHRGISHQILIDLKVTSKKEFMPQTSKEENCICFNYFINNELVNIKSRDGKKNFKLFKGAKLVLYNLDSIKESQEIYITEGEIDCLSIHECGIKNVISVPNGANNNLGYLDNCWELVKDKKIIIATDNDESGIKLKLELAKRFGFDNCTYIDLNYKHTNIQIIL